jgi:hypothetical protein
MITLVFQVQQPMYDFGIVNSRQLIDFIFFQIQLNFPIKKPF